MFKKILLSILITLVSALPAQASLYQYYQEQGKPLPNVQDRANIASQYGISPYSGTTQQNTLLENKLRGEKKLGFGVATDYHSTLSQPMNSTQSFFFVSSLKTGDGNYVATSTLGASIMFFTIEPGSTNEEVVGCLDDVTSTRQVFSCYRGLSFVGNSTSSVAANQHTHSASSIVIMSNVQYVYKQFVDKDTAETIGGQKTFTVIPLIPTSTPTDPAAVVSLATLASTSYAGTVNASTLQKGIVQIATDNEFLSGTVTGTTGAVLVPGNASELTYKAVHLNNAVPFGEIISAFNVLYTSSTGRYAIAKATNLSSIDSIAAVAFEAGVNGNFKRAYTPGSVIFGDATTPLATSTLVYLSDTGFPTTTNSGTNRKVLGVSLYNNAWVFIPSVDTAVPTSTAFRIPLAKANGTISDGWLNAYIYGDCSDGNVTNTTPLTLTRDAYYNNFYNSSTVNPAGYKLFVCNTFTNSASGTISRDGSNGGAGGAASSATGGTAGVAGAALNSGTLVGGTSLAGGAGGGNNTVGFAGTDGASSVYVYGVAAAAGGAGGQAGTKIGGVGGVAGTKTAVGTSLRDLNSFMSMTGVASGAVGAITPCPDAGSGGGGGGSNGGTTAGGGGGGASGVRGGTIWISARTFNNLGTISSKGGNGGVGGAGYAGDSSGGGGGGGGGGCGGLDVNIFNTQPSYGTYTLTGGTGGTGGAGANGAANGVTGGSGNTGTQLQIQLQ